MQGLTGPEHIRQSARGGNLHLLSCKTRVLRRAMSQHHQIIITLRQRERDIAEILVVQFLIDVLPLLPFFILDVETQVITHITQLTT